MRDAVTLPKSESSIVSFETFIYYIHIQKSRSYIQQSSCNNTNHIVKEA